MDRTYSLFIGAYAAYATLPQLTLSKELEFLQELYGLDFVRGLELPFTSDIHPEDAEGFLAALPEDWEYIFTLLPGTMQSLQRSPHFGLASADEGGRQAALAHCELARARILAWHERLGKNVVRYVHLHSAPKLGSRDVLSTKDALERSLTTLLSRDWGGAELVLEHCDAYRPDYPSVKGFMTLQDELALAQKIQLGMTINWGRSALETRGAQGARDHVLLTQRAKVLKGVFFSGTAIEDPLYGHWQDNHAPVRLNQQRPWEPSQGVLSLVEVAEIWEALKTVEMSYYGLKVQPFPSDLSAAQRIACLKEQIQALRKLSTEIILR